MKIYQYNNYQEYVNSQVEANIRKIKNKWVEKKTIEEIYKRYKLAESIICHGTRNAAEQKYFQEFYPNAEILGTEISHTAKDFPMTIQWDFHEDNPVWIDKFDIVYSNAFDHSYNPEKVLNCWKMQLKNNGRLFLEHGYGETENISKQSDPLQIYEDELIILFNKVGLYLVDSFYSTGNKGACPCKIYVLSK